jgi:hypothetical protein
MTTFFNSKLYLRRVWGINSLCRFKWKRTSFSLKKVYSVAWDVNGITPNNWHRFFPSEYSVDYRCQINPPAMNISPKSLIEPANKERLQVSNDSHLFIKTLGMDPTNIWIKGRIQNEINRVTMEIVGLINRSLRMIQNYNNRMWSQLRMLLNSCEWFNKLAWLVMTSD